jgi:dienelactone hydrolase
MLKYTPAILLGSFMMMSHAYGAIKAEPIEYTKNGVTMEGYFAYDDAKEGPLPGVLIVPDWMGVGSLYQDKAKELAKEGYAALVVDVYGKGVRPKNTEEAGAMAKKYLADRALLRERVQAGYGKLISMNEVMPSKIAVVGYCFGGTGALELARSGKPLLGTVTFHGGLSDPSPHDAKNIKGKVLILHGADDPNVPPKEVEAFKKEMKDAGIAFEFVAYPGAVHAFTNPAAGNDKSKGVAYNADADKNSWNRFKDFLKEIFR